MIAIILPTLLGIASTSASEIRDFDLKTIEFLGRHLYEYQNQTAKSLSNREANAIEATKTALNHRIDKSYKLIVLHDPTKSGYLVYALATSKDPNDVVLGIHYRVSVSANSNSVERVDALSRSRVVVNKMEAHALWMIQLLSVGLQ